MAGLEQNEVAFPTLADEQVRELEQWTAARRRRCADGEVLFSAGARDYPFFVVLSGAIEIVDVSGEEPRTLVTHRRANFTGDVSLVVGARAVAMAVARGDTEVLEVPRDAMRRMLDECPVLGDVVLRALIARRQLLRDSADFTGLRVIGSRFSPDTFRVRDFLARNRVLFTWIDLESDPDVDRLLKEFGLTASDTPVVTCGHTVILRNPTNLQLADAVGIHRPIEDTLYDLVVVGAGPAGLAAAVYGSSEGLRTLVLERSAPGGQAGSSMRIENYLGFPMGITGAELTDRAIVQAAKFGATISVPSCVQQLAFENGYPVVRLENDGTITARCLVIATGATYRRLEAENCARYEGAGVYYAATPYEATLCRDCYAVVVGGGNSAGQASVFLSQQASKVIHVIRGDDLYKSMSAYLARRIEVSDNIELVKNTVVERMEGDGHLASVLLRDKATGKSRTVQTPAVFSFIGAVPHTDWLPVEIERDAKGFVRTGAEIAQSPHWPLRRTPFLLETSKPGVFAAGDVRASPVKRLAAAVGEGSMAVQFVHAVIGQA